MRITHPFALSLLAVWLVLAVGNPAFAARLLSATVELDGKIVLITTYQDDSNPHPERVWRYLGKEPGWAEVAKVQPSPTDPLQAKLRGALVIRFGRIIEGKASELTLIRKDPSSDRWFLPSEEVERIAQANGIPRPSIFALSEGEAWFAAIEVGGALLVIALVLFVVIWCVWAFSRARRASVRD